MSSSSAGTVLLEPTDLYNMLTKECKDPAILDPSYLVLLDVRDWSDYSAAHVTLARSAKNWLTETKDLNLPHNIHLPTTRHCVVYDDNTVSNFEETPAVELANKLALNGSKNSVMILKGGYERFSAEYPFLRTEKILYTPRELQKLPRYPNEIVPLFLYLGDVRHANNAALNYDLKIRTHLLVGNEVEPALSGEVQTLQIGVSDKSDSNLLVHFAEAFTFIESCSKRSERVLVYEETGCSRSAAIVVAYLVKKNKMSLKEAMDHVKKCKQRVLPLQVFLDQLAQWESQVKEQLRRQDKV